MELEEETDLGDTHEALEMEDPLEMMDCQTKALSISMADVGQCMDTLKRDQDDMTEYEEHEKHGIGKKSNTSNSRILPGGQCGQHLGGAANGVRDRHEGIGTVYRSEVRHTAS